MNKVFLLLAGTIFFLMSQTSPAQIRNLFNAGAPIAILLWFLPLLLLFVMYRVFKNYPAATFNEPRLAGSKGGYIKIEPSDTNEKDDLEIAAENNDISTQGDKFRE